MSRSLEGLALAASHPTKAWQEVDTGILERMGELLLYMVLKASIK